MTAFIDGPAQGQKLQLRRAPVYLRVTEKDGKFDGLDQLGDTPEPGETMYAYVLAEQPGAMHLLVRGKEAASRGGIWPIAKYKLFPIQPDQATMRSRADWQEWTYAAGKPAWMP